MTNVTEVKRTLKEHSELFGSVVGDSRRYESKFWYLTGILSGILHDKHGLTGAEFVELNEYLKELLQEA